MPTTGDVLDQHLKSFGENDLDGVLADYSSDAVLFVPRQTAKGPGRNQAFFPGFLFGVCKAWRVVFDAAAIR